MVKWPFGTHNKIRNVRGVVSTTHIPNNYLTAQHSFRSVKNIESLWSTTEHMRICVGFRFHRIHHKSNSSGNLRTFAQQQHLEQILQSPPQMSRSTQMVVLSQPTTDETNNHSTQKTELVAAGHCPGFQTINCAELFAMLIAAETADESHHIRTAAFGTD